MTEKPNSQHKSDRRLTRELRLAMRHVVSAYIDDERRDLEETAGGTKRLNQAQLKELVPNHIFWDFKTLSQPNTFGYEAARRAAISVAFMWLADERRSYSESYNVTFDHDEEGQYEGVAYVPFTAAATLAYHKGFVRDEPLPHVLCHLLAMVEGFGIYTNVTTE